MKSKIRIEKLDGALHIRYRWMVLSLMPLMVVFTSVCIGMPAYLMYLGQPIMPEYGIWGQRVLYFVMGFCLYFTLVFFFNRSDIHINSEELTIRHLPFPWIKGNKRLPVSEIHDLAVKRKVTKSREGTHEKFYLIAKLQNGETFELLSIPNQSQEETKLLEETLDEFVLDIRKNEA
ncbi:hypothetical protein [Pontibacter sp. G13]|uniref:hypothetical protein n=1 Tax=Pontibacter sp. G13 TaxID=3074898 RepID=UPI002889E3C2|nr:hypothetical protein [Pontibacter sp. G13]WNJ18414.1 hypothetical protein RJD25_26465 [Pontibacter sp. G13]